MEHADVVATRDRVATAFDRNTDPLAAHEAAFEGLDADPLDMFVRDVLDERDIVDTTKSTYEYALRHWRAYMTEQGRHPACPNESLVAGFIDYLSDEHDNSPRTIRGKLGRVKEAYQYWQRAPEFPHTDDYEPFAIVISQVTWDVSDQKSPPPLTTGELAGVIQSVMHLRDRAIILLQLKCGLRASEVCNVKLSEIDVQSAPLQRTTDSLGTHWALEDRPNAVYIPHDRERNKSGNPRVIPLDSETRAVLERYLFARREASVPWLFIPKGRCGQLEHPSVTDVWTSAFQPAYGETKHHRPITSHFGRHYFTTYWRVEQDLPRPLVQYLRGDGPATESVLDQDGIDHYIHSHYEDIEDIYRDRIFHLGLHQRQSVD